MDILKRKSTTAKNIQKIAKEILAEDQSVNKFIQKVSEDFDPKTYLVTYIKSWAKTFGLDLKGKEKEITNLINSSLVKATPGIIKEALWTYKIVDYK
jgi:hypothetical protein